MSGDTRPLMRLLDQPLEVWGYSDLEAVRTGVDELVAQLDAARQRIVELEEREEDRRQDALEARTRDPS